MFSVYKEHPMQSTIPPTHSNLRTFTACLLSFMMLVAPIASVAATMRRDIQPVVAPKAESSSKSVPLPQPQPARIASVNNSAVPQPLAPLAFACPDVVSVPFARSTQPRLAPRSIVVKVHKTRRPKRSPTRLRKQKCLEKEGFGR